METIQDATTCRVCASTTKIKAAEKIRHGGSNAQRQSSKNPDLNQCFVAPAGSHFCDVPGRYDLIRCENDDGHDKGTGHETPFSVPLFTLRPFKVQQSSDDAFTYSRPARHDSPDH